MNESSEHEGQVEGRSGRGIPVRYVVPLLILAVLGAGGAVMLFSPRNRVPSRSEAAPAAIPGSSYPQSTTAASQNAADSGTAINTRDPISGKPVSAGISSIYKGHVIGHCCQESQRHWAALTSGEKDVHLAKMLGK